MFRMAERSNEKIECSKCLEAFAASNLNFFNARGSLRTSQIFTAVEVRF